MKITSSHINIILAAAIIVLLLFPRKGQQIQDKSGEIKALQQVIESKESERDIYRAWKDETVSLLQKRDSVLKTEYKTTVIKYAKIPDNIRNLNNEELRRAVENY